MARATATPRFSSLHGQRRSYFFVLSVCYIVIVVSFGLSHGCRAEDLEVSSGSIGHRRGELAWKLHPQSRDAVESLPVSAEHHTEKPSECSALGYVEGLMSSPCGTTVREIVFPLSNDAEVGRSFDSSSSSSASSSSASGSGGEAETSSSASGSGSGSDPFLTSETITDEDAALLQQGYAYVGSVAVTISTCILSPVLILLMVLRRNKFPFTKLNVHLLITAEVIIVSAVPFVCSGFLAPLWYPPCLMVLAMWEINLFPCVGFIVLNVLKLKIDYQVAHDKIYNRESFYFRHSRRLQSPWLQLGVGILLWIVGWLGVIEQLVKTAPVWFETYDFNDWECITFPDSGAVIDQVNGFALTLLVAIVLFRGLRGVDEAMGAKPAFLAGGICMSLYTFLYDLLILSRIDETLYLKQAQIGVFLVYLFHIYSWTVTLPLVYISFKNPERKGLQTKTVVVGSRAVTKVASSESGARSDADRSTNQGKRATDGQQSPAIFFAKKPHEVLTAIVAATSEELQSMKVYFQKEFAAENLLFLASSVLYKHIPSEESRMKKMKEMIEEYVVEGSPLEINISASLRKAIIRAGRDSTTNKAAGKTVSQSEGGENSGVKGRLIQVAARRISNLASDHNMLDDLLIKTEPPGSLTFWNAVDEEVLTMAMDPFNRFVGQYATARKTQSDPGPRGAQKKNNSNNKTAPDGGNGSDAARLENWLVAKLRSKTQSERQSSESVRVEWWKDLVAEADT